ncbi:IQ domain-containing protein H-like isoform X2 [Lineus longissimus]|uniref:IQ domain-containing protein H-like isoform X2 n=1 Tax=Lineus longissimus TaxID=88925 RepID=UPI00315D73B7
MPVMTDLNNHDHDVGEILVRVQEDLHQLKERLLSQVQKDGGGMDATSIEEAMQKTEEEIRLKTENLVNQMNNRVLTLPSLESQGHGNQHTTSETTWDLKDVTKDNKVRRASNEQQALSRKPFILPKEKIQTHGLTPAQVLKTGHNVKAIHNPYNPQNRNVLHDNYGIQLPLIVDKRHNRVAEQKPVHGSTIEPLAILPKANRVDPQLVPPPISDTDAKKGILNLIERGLIPPAAELTLDPSPVRHRTAALHDPVDKDRKSALLAITDSGYNFASVKLDTSVKGSESMSSLQHRRSQVTISRDVKSADMSSARTSKTPAAVRTFEMPLHPLPPPTTPASNEFRQTSHRFAIQHGKIRDNTPEFLAFKQHYCLSWGSNVTIMRHLQKMLIDHAIPLAFIDGDKLADLAQEFELEKTPTIDDLLSVIVNSEDVESLIKRPGRKFLGPDGQRKAATVIQSFFRRHRDRTKYLAYRRQKWAAGVIAISWIMNVKMANVRRQLKKTRLDYIESFKNRAKKLASSWDRVRNSRRVVIHVPSLGVSQNIRNSITEMGIRQNVQMGRLCDISDPNVDVIYICPVALNDETMQYYAKLLGLRNAIDTGSVEEQMDVTDRYKIIVPEATKHFPTHNMCLSSLLKYSPRTLRRIKNLVRGRNAYIVPGVPHKDDLAVAEKLDLPILCPEPEVARLYSTKSGSKRIFASAAVQVPPGEYDVYSLPQLHECLATLITENLGVKRWLFKLDDEFDGRGIAYVDIPGNLRCYNWAVKESLRYGEKWSKKWAQEPAYIKIHAEVPELLSNFAKPVNKVYATWQKFIDAFLSQGGVVEACPPSESVTALTVNMFIEPSGKITMVSMGDQIKAETPYQCWGLSVPQSSVEPADLNKICNQVAEACKARGVVGYFSVDFVTFIDAKTMEQAIWAVDLDLCYSDTAAMTSLMHFVTNATLDPLQHTLDIPPPIKEEKRQRKLRFKKVEEDEPPVTSRFAVMSTRLLHSNLAVVHYSVFFQMCRAHGIGYDIKEKQGTAFTLVDSFNRENLGMLTIGDNLQGALATFARNMSVIHQEISAPNMQGDTNFKAAIEDIEGILGTTIQNAEESESGLEDVEN